MTINKWITLAATAGLLCLGTVTALAQADNQSGAGRPTRGNFDPAQFRDRMMQNIREQLEITDDSEWKAVEPMVQKVFDARMATMNGMGRGMFRGRRGGQDNNGGDQPQRRGPFGQSTPEADALQKAIDAKAPKAEVKAALEKFVAARKAKQAELEQSQADLRKVLTSRQEAIATLNGLL